MSAGPFVQDFNRKKKVIKGLKEKALSRNPDEFYFKMQNSVSARLAHACTRSHARPHAHTHMCSRARARTQAVKDGVHRSKNDVGLDSEVIKVNIWQIVTE